MDALYALCPEICRWLHAICRFRLATRDQDPYFGDRMMPSTTRLDFACFRALTSWATLALLVAAIVALSIR